MAIRLNECQCAVTMCRASSAAATLATAQETMLATVSRARTRARASRRTFPITW